MLIITGEQFRAMAAACEAAYPDEGCGALLGWVDGKDRVVADVLPLQNATLDAKRTRFSVSSHDLLALMRQERESGRRVVGYFHSHPDHPAVPSETDRQAAWSEYSYPILSVVGGRASTWNSWRLREDGTGYDAELVKILV